MEQSPAEQQLASFIGKFSPEIAALAQSVLAAMTERYPTAIQLVYDNYNALAIGFGPTEGASEAIFSTAFFPRWVSLFFLQGAWLPDPDGILQGSGNVARHIRLPSADTLNELSVKNDGGSYDASPVCSSRNSPPDHQVDISQTASAPSTDLTSETG